MLGDIFGPDPAEIQAADDAELREHLTERFREGLESILSTTEGRFVLHQLMLDAGYGKLIGAGDALGAHWQIGRQSLGVHIAQAVRSVDPYGVIRMETERQDLLLAFQSTQERRRGP